MAYDDPKRPHRYMVKKTDLVLDVWYKYPELSLHELISRATAGREGILTDEDFAAAIEKLGDER